MAKQLSRLKQYTKCHYNAANCNIGALTLPYSGAFPECAQHPVRNQNISVNKYKYVLMI